MTPREEAMEIINRNSQPFADNNEDADNIAISECKVEKAIDIAIEETRTELLNIIKDRDNFEEEQEKAIKQLQKENQELREHIKDLNEDITVYTLNQKEQKK